VTSKKDERDEAAALPGEGDFFDPSFVAELEALAAAHTGPQSPRTISATLHDHLRAFLQRQGPEGEVEPQQILSEEEFVALSAASLAQRTNGLLETCRQAGATEAVRTVESFIVFFQALVPTLVDEGAREVKRFFFRLAPTLLHIAYNDFSDTDDRRRDGQAALKSLEAVLLEISSVRLTPSETEVVFRSIDQMAAFIGVGEYAMASEIISTQLLGIIQRNKLMRALFRLMEVEVSVQRFLKAHLGYATPQIRVPEDFEALAEYGPLRVLHETPFDGPSRYLLQVHIPDVPFLRDVVVHLAGADGTGYDLRLDALGSTELTVPPGTYSIGLVYQP